MTSFLVFFLPSFEFALISLKYVECLTHFFLILYFLAIHMKIEVFSYQILPSPVPPLGSPWRCTTAFYFFLRVISTVFYFLDIVVACFFSFALDYNFSFLKKWAPIVIHKGHLPMCSFKVVSIWNWIKDATSCKMKHFMFYYERKTNWN